MLYIVNHVKYRGNRDVEVDIGVVGELGSERELGYARSVGMEEGLVDSELRKGRRAEGNVALRVLNQDLIFHAAAILVLALLDAEGGGEDVRLRAVLSKTF